MGAFERKAVQDVEKQYEKFTGYQVANDEKARYYDGKFRLKDLGIAIPPRMRLLDTVVGWPGTVVDVLDERLDFEGWTDKSLDELFRVNDLDVRSSQAHVDALLYGTSFVMVTAGGEGEPPVVVSTAAPTQMVATRDARHGTVSEACLFLGLENTNDPDTQPRAVLFRPNETVWLSGSPGGGAWTVESVDEHMLGRVPVAQLVNRPRSSKAGGRSEITPAVRSYTDMALRTLVGAEVAREFYAVPQRWMMGAPESFFVTEDGEQRSAWEATMGRFLAAERDPETGEMPQVGQFSAYSMSPFFEQIRHLSQLLAAETAIPATYLGFVSDNPSSADAIRMAENRLVKRAERRQGMFGQAWTEVCRLALMIRDGKTFGELTPEELAIRPLWRDAATPTKAAATDQVQKLVSLGLPFGEYMMKLLSMSPQEKEMLERDMAQGLRSALMDSIRARAAQPADPVVESLVQKRGE